MTLGVVPSIWCKGVISPIHKSGDPLNPENYRPGSETSQTGP